jgi:hypothetical protein
MDDSKWEIAASITGFALFALSEYLAHSPCKSNSLVQLFIGMFGKKPDSVDDLKHSTI